MRWARKVVSRWANLIDDSTTDGSVPYWNSTLWSPTSALTFTGTTVDFSQQALFSAGSEGAPSISFSGDPNTGLYWWGADAIGVSTAGGRKIWIGPYQTRFYGGNSLWLVNGSGTAGINYMSFYLSDETTRTAWLGYGGTSDLFSIANERPGGGFRLILRDAGNVSRTRIDVYADGDTIFTDNAGTTVMRIKPGSTYMFGDYSAARLIGTASTTLAGPLYLDYLMSDGVTRSALVGFSGAFDHFQLVNYMASGSIRLIVKDSGGTIRNRQIISAAGPTFFYDENGSEVMRLDASYKARVVREGRYTEVLLPAGTLLPFAANSTLKIPVGYLECNGQAVSRTTYADLFANLSTLWGAGDGSTTFNVPDLRGRFVMGYGGSSGTTAGTLGGSWNHTHSFSDSFVTGGPSQTISIDVGTGLPKNPASAAHTHSGSVSGTTGSNNPPYASIIWMIKV